MRVKNKKTLLLLLATITWMGVIFFFSSQPGEESEAVSGFIVEKLIAIFGSADSYIIRKGGHVIEYFILGMLTFAFLKSAEVKKHAFFAALVCMIYAATDELHQMFVPGRGPGVRDVILDTVASIFGIFFLFAAIKGYKKIASRRNV